jgi:signal transduction histidine kinase
MSASVQPRAPFPGLQARFLLIVGSTALLLSLVVWGVFNSVVEHMVERIGMRFAEKQVLYDKSRTLQPLIREIALARQLADVPIIKQWAANEGNAQLKHAALAELESRRRHFQDGSYFLALADSKHYYYNNAAGEFTATPLRYTLDAGKQADAWFFATLKSPESFHINIDPDISLGVTKVWINVLLRDDKRVLGVLGTGIDLTKFIAEVVDIPQPGVTSLFIDPNAAIQLYRRIDYIDYSSIAKSVDEQRSIDQLLQQPEDRAWVREAIQQISRDEHLIATRFVPVEGKRYLAAMAALPEVGWFSVTLLDLDVLLPQTDFYAMGGAIGGTALGILAILAWALHRRVVRPLAELTDATEKVGAGDFALAPLRSATDEVGRLATRFFAMAGAVEKTQHALGSEIDRRLRELTDSKRMLEVALHQERESREAQSSLLAMMAHEVRNPVAVISTAAQTMDILTEQPDLKPRIAKILGAVHRIAQLMDNLLANERLTTAGASLECQADDLDAYCTRLVAALSELYGRPIRCETLGVETRLSADWQLLGIAVGNLIDNAVKYTPASGAIVLKVLRPAATQLCIEVADEGPGIMPELQQQIFEKFSRGQNEPRVAGAGLGLYLVQFVARLHGGHVELISAPGAGSRFRILLPVRE